MVNDETVMRYLENGNAVLSMDEMREMQPVLKDIHRVASSMQSTHDLFDVCVKLSALNLIVATGFAEEHSKMNKCLSTAKHIVSIR